MSSPKNQVAEHEELAKRQRRELRGLPSLIAELRTRLERSEKRLEELPAELENTERLIRYHQRKAADGKKESKLKALRKSMKKVQQELRQVRRCDGQEGAEVKED